MFAGNPELNQAIGSYVVKAVVGLIVGGLMGVILWPLKYAKKEWTELKEQMKSTHAELESQRTNCLTTLQSQGNAQIELLKDSVRTLGDIRIELAEQTGFLRAANTTRSTVNVVRKRKARA
jgi:uncharacterized membrane-anchored protein YhcB (DUF1043 family)